MLDSECTVNQFMVGYGRMLVGDLPDERMTEQPLPGVNHPAWILGHLAVTAESGAKMLGGEATLPEDWAAKFGPGSKTSASRSDYPSKEALLSAFEGAFERLRTAAKSATTERLSAPSPHPRTKAMLPTVGDLASFLLAGHFGIHLGQISMWRRMTGMPPLF